MREIELMSEETKKLWVWILNRRYNKDGERYRNGWNSLSTHSFSLFHVLLAAVSPINVLTKHQLRQNR